MNTPTPHHDTDTPLYRFRIAFDCALSNGIDHIDYNLTSDVDLLNGADFTVIVEGLQNSYGLRDVRITSVELIRDTRPARPVLDRPKEADR